jgi:hypothetical protein
VSPKLGPEGLPDNIPTKFVRSGKSVAWELRDSGEGDHGKMFNSYNLATQDDHGQLMQVGSTIYATLRSINPNLRVPTTEDRDDTVEIVKEITGKKVTRVD